MPRSTRSSQGVCSWNLRPSCSKMPPSSRRSSLSIARPFSSFDSSFHLFSVQPRRSRMSSSSFRSLKNRLLLISASAFRRQADFRFRGSSGDFRLAAEKRPVLAPHIQTPRNWPSPSATKRSLRYTQSSPHCGSRCSKRSATFVSSPSSSTPTAPSGAGSGPSPGAGGPPVPLLEPPQGARWPATRAPAAAASRAPLLTDGSAKRSVSENSSKCSASPSM
mmetsp:Transcript_17596/g.48581  ORF Transcript_17596/g.48581 Transcript_17596/m.48581 type:complete len:220 (+) Transcript_17596:1527-2186(+)